MSIDPSVRSVAVYCGSSDRCPEHFKQAARDLGHLLAREKLRLVYGGGRVGLMGIVANATMEAGGEVLGYMTEFLNSYEGGFDSITELHVVPTMHERKQKMFDHSDAFVIMPGGFGTLDEAFEIITWKQLGFHDKQIVFLDIDHFWRPLFEHFVNHLCENRFIREEDKKLFSLVHKVEDVSAALNQPRALNHGIASKWG